MNDSSVTRDRREELGIFCYKAPTLPLNGTVLFEGGLMLAVNPYCKLQGNHTHTYIHTNKQKKLKQV